MNKTIKEFLKGTRNHYHIEITEGNNDNIIFKGTYAELKKSRNDLMQEIVISWDACGMDDGTIDIGIMI